MGGRGSSSASGATAAMAMSRRDAVATMSAGAITGDEPISLRNEKSMSSGDRWRYTVLSAESDASGNLTISYATPTSYDRVNRNTTYANDELKAGFYNEPGRRSIQTHNIDMDKVKSMSGQTYALKEIAKAAGMKWDSRRKAWVK